MKESRTDMASLKGDRRRSKASHITGNVEKYELGPGVGGFLGAAALTRFYGVNIHKYGCTL